METTIKGYMLMPFKNEINDDVYKTYIKPVAQKHGIELKRSDEEIVLANIQGDVIRGIDEADIIIAELTGGNPNVFYELAIAHSFNKPTIMISRNIQDLPFDIMSQRTIIYEYAPRELKYLEAQLGGMFLAFSMGRLSFSSPVLVNLPESPFAIVHRTKKVLEIEQKANKRVCVIAPDIAMGPLYFKEVMRKNMVERGIAYQYLIAHSPSVMKNCNDFFDELNLGDKESLFSIKTIDPEYIESDVTLIDPGIKGERGFILAPSEKAEFNFEVIGGALVRLKERFNTLWFKADDIV